MEIKVAILYLIGDAILVVAWILLLCVLLFVVFSIAGFLYPHMIDWFHWMKRRFEYEYIEKINE